MNKLLLLLAVVTLIVMVSVRTTTAMWAGDLVILALAGIGGLLFTRRTKDEAQRSSGS